MIKILLLEDDYLYKISIKEFLEELDFAVDDFDNGEDALNSIFEKRYDLLLLDIRVPKMDGFELVKNVREASIDTPIIILTSLTDIKDLSRGYTLGCNDYIRKPFDIKELLLRVQTLIKKEFSNKNEVVEISPNVTFNTISNELKSNNEEIKLNLKELKLLKFFLQNPNELLSHDRIYDFVWDYDEEYSDNSLRTYIKNLRKILGKDKIVSFKKLGYRFIQE